MCLLFLVSCESEQSFFKISNLQDSYSDGKDVEFELTNISSRSVYYEVGVQWFDAEVGWREYISNLYSYRYGQKQIIKQILPQQTIPIKWTMKSVTEYVKPKFNSESKIRFVIKCSDDENALIYNSSNKAEVIKNYSKEFFVKL